MGRAGLEDTFTSNISFCVVESRNVGMCLEERGKSFCFLIHFIKTILAVCSRELVNFTTKWQPTVNLISQSTEPNITTSSLIRGLDLSSDIIM